MIEGGTRDANRLNIVLITHGITPFVESLLSSEHNVIGFVESFPPGKFSFRAFASTRTSKNNLNDIAGRDIPYFSMKTGGDTELEEWLSNLAPDVIVVFMSKILQENIFSIPKYGTINLHPSMLPKHRGPNPIFWQYYHMELSPGVTVHYIDKGEDTGDIICQESYTIPLGMKSSDMLDIMINKIGTPLLLKALDQISQGTAPRIVQQSTGKTPRARRLSEKEHESIIDWETWEIERIWHLLRGTGSSIRAFGQSKGFYYCHEWEVLGFEKFEIGEYKAGKVYKENSRFFLACRDGKIYLAGYFSLRLLFKSLLGIG